MPKSPNKLDIILIGVHFSPPLSYMHIMTFIVFYSVTFSPVLAYCQAILDKSLGVDVLMCVLYAS